jgi:hypothetical protein
VESDHAGFSRDCTGNRKAAKRAKAFDAANYCEEKADNMNQNYDILMALPLLLIPFVITHAAIYLMIKFLTRKK